MQAKSETLGVSLLSLLGRFSCTGPACPATCCQGWQVPVDQGRYGRIKRHLLPVLGPEVFAEALQLRASAERTRDDFARVTLRADGSCSFWDGDRLCQIQKQAGPQGLPQTCAAFPRTFAYLGQRLEISLSLSCPEVARLVFGEAGDLALLAASGQPVALVASLVEMAPPAPRLTKEAARAFDIHLRSLRQALVDVLLSSCEPVSVWLRRLVWLGRASYDLFAEVERGGRFHQAAFALLLAELGKVPVVSLPLLPAVPKGEPLLGEVPLHPGFAALHARHSLGTTTSEQPTDDPDLDPLLKRYCHHQLLHRSYIQEGTLFRYVLGLVAKVALLRQVVPRGQSQETLVAAFIEAVYCLSRTVEHGEAFSAFLYKWETQGLAP